MKKNNVITLFFILLISHSYAQKNNKNILKSSNIGEIEEYLKKAHPDDPKRIVLKSKIIALKNEEWTKGKKNAKPMEARPIITEIPNRLLRNPNSEEAEEFKKLIVLSDKEHKEKTAKILTAMFDEDITSKEAILLFKNNSDCNIVLRIQGKNFYNLAVPAWGENSIVIRKDVYHFSANVCDVKYDSQKDIKKSIFVVLGNPSYKNTGPETAVGKGSELNNSISAGRSATSTSKKKSKP